MTPASTSSAAGRTSVSSSAPPRWFRFVAWLAVLWMLFGVAAWVMDLLTDESQLAELSDAQRQLYATRPTWLFGVYGLAIVSGLVGAVGLVRRAHWSVPTLAVSLAAIVVQFGYTFLGLDAVRLLGPALALPFPLLIFVIGLTLLLLARKARARGWLHAKPDHG